MNNHYTKFDVGYRLGAQHMLMAFQAPLPGASGPSGPDWTGGPCSRNQVQPVQPPPPNGPNTWKRHRFGW